MASTRQILIALLLLVCVVPPCLAVPPFEVSLPKVLEQADYAGVVKIIESPPVGKMGVRADAPPVVVVRPISNPKGEPKGDLRIVWQTFCPSCFIRDPATVEVLPPAIGNEFMVFLARGKDGAYTRSGYFWHFHPMPAAPSVRTQSSDAWRGLIEVSPAVAGPGEAVRYLFTRMRLAAEPWEGTESNIIAADIVVVDFARKQVLVPVKAGVRASGLAVIECGQTVVDVVDLTAAFGIMKPGEYWVFKGGAVEGNAPLRFEVTDRLRLRTGGGPR